SATDLNTWNARSQMSGTNQVGHPLIGIPTMRTVQLTRAAGAYEFAPKWVTPTDIDPVTGHSPSGEAAARQDAATKWNGGKFAQTSSGMGARGSRGTCGWMENENSFSNNPTGDSRN